MTVLDALHEGVMFVITAGAVPLSTPPEALRVVMMAVYVPGVDVLVSPVTWMEIVVFDGTEIPFVTVYVSVAPASATAPDPMPFTVPTAAVPAVPDGTVMVTDVSVAAVAVVKVNV